MSLLNIQFQQDQQVTINGTIYQIKEELGRGAMGVKFRAVNVEQRSFTLSFIIEQQNRHSIYNNPELFEEFMKMNHPHIQKIFGCERMKINKIDVIVAVEEYVEYHGEQNMKLKEGIATKVILQVCCAAQYLHDRNIIHRDIQPESLLFDKEGNAKLSHFDNATKVQTEMTRLGRDGYYAPEIYYNVVNAENNLAKYDTKADVWSIGMLALQLLTGQKVLFSRIEDKITFEIHKYQQISQYVIEMQQQENFIQQQLLKLTGQIKQQSLKQLILDFLQFKPDFRPVLRTYMLQNFTNELQQYNLIELLNEQKQVITQLMQVAKEGDIQTLRQCKTQFIKLQSQEAGKEGYTALMYAVENNQYDCAKELLEEASMQNQAGETALCIALVQQNQQMIQLLAPKEQQYMQNETKFIEIQQTGINPYIAQYYLTKNCIQKDISIKELMENENDQNIQNRVIENPTTHEKYKVMKEIFRNEEIDEENDEIVRQVLILKVLDESQKERICKVIFIKKSHLKRQEGIDILSNLNHPNIVKQISSFYFFDSECNCYTFSIQEMGTSIDQFFKDGISARQLHKLAFQTCKAVNYLHQHNIIHRDVKPDNMVIQGTAENWNLQLIGLSTSIKVANILDMQTECIGTPGFMAAEVTMGQYNYKCDLYSIGKTIQVFSNYLKDTKIPRSIQLVIQSLTNTNSEQRMSLHAAANIIEPFIIKKNENEQDLQQSEDNEKQYQMLASATKEIQSSKYNLYTANSLKVQFEQKMTKQDFIKFAIELCKTLLFLHNNRVIHRDIKPNNIIIIQDEQGWHVQIIDFDNSIIVVDINAIIQKVCENSSVGFTAPELINGAYNYKCDIYSAGRTLDVVLQYLPENERSQFKEIINGMTALNVNERLSLEEAIKKFERMK